MKVILLFDLEKRLFLSYLPTKLSWEVEIWYVHLIGILHLRFGGLDFQVSLHSFKAPKCSLLVSFSHVSN